MNENSDLSTAGIPGHYVYRGPSAALGIVSIVLALTMLGYAVNELRQAGHNQSTLSLVARADTTGDLPVLLITPVKLQLNGSPINESDLLFRLSAMTASAQGIIVEYTPELSAAEIAKSLSQVNQAGFTQVALRQADSTTTTRVSASERPW